MTNDFPSAVLDWLATLPDDQLDDAELLLSAALDEQDGDPMASLTTAVGVLGG